MEPCLRRSHTSTGQLIAAAGISQVRPCIAGVYTSRTWLLIICKSLNGVLAAELAGPTTAAGARLTFPGESAEAGLRSRRTGRMRFKADLVQVGTLSSILSALVPLAKISVLKLKKETVHLIAIEEGPGKVSVWW